MKAGIFKTTDGTLLYVGKDQYVRASLGAKSLDGYKVVYSKARDAVSIVAAMTNGHRVANVRNGFNRSALDLLHDIANKIENPDVLDLHGGAMRYEAEEANDDDFSLNVDGNDSARETMREGTLVPPADAPEGDPVDLDPELAAYHGEADDSDREAVNLLPDDVSPAQSLHEFVAERLHRIDAGGAAPPVFVEKPTDISADGLREILAHKEEVQQEIARKMAMPKELFSPYCGLPPQTVFLSTPSDAKRFVEKHLQAKSSDTPVSRYAANMFARLDAQRHIEQVANGSTDEDGLDIGGALSATGTVTVTFSDHKTLNQIREFARRMSEQAPPPTCVAVEKGSEVYHELVRRIAAASGHTVAEVEAWIGLRCGEFRLCHAAAARKHKKKRDRHVWWHPVFGCYAWKKIEARA